MRSQPGNSRWQPRLPRVLEGDGSYSEPPFAQFGDKEQEQKGSGNQHIVVVGQSLADLTVEERSEGADSGNRNPYGVGRPAAPDFRAGRWTQDDPGSGRTEDGTVII